MKKVLVGYVSDFKTSGIDKYIINFIDSVKSENISFDFLTRSDSPNAKQIINERGYQLYKVSRNRHFLKQFLEMKKIIKKNKYDIAYFNISESFNCVGIIAAKLFGIKKVIVHSHSSGIEKDNFLMSFVCKMINLLFKPIISVCSDLNLSCSDKAAKWLFSSNIYDNNDYEIIYNPVDYKKFKFDGKVRERIRKQYGIDDKMVIGHIGRFSYQKNHKFLLDIFAEYLKQNKNSVLFCVGDGPDFEKIVEYSKKLGIYEKIIFTGAIDNVNEIIQSFDCFLLPSRFEGLPIVALEAQFSGVKCIVSNKVSNMSIISNHSILLPINNPTIWAQNISSERTTLNKDADNYMLSKNQAQFNKIFNDVSGKYNVASVIFKLLLVIHYLLNLTVFFNGFNYLMILCGVLLPIIVFSGHFGYFKTKKENVKLYALYLLFIVSYIVTFTLMKKYDIVGSGKILIWTILHMFLIFNTSYMRNIGDLKKEIYNVFNFSIIVMSILNLHNLYLLISHIQTTMVDFEGKIHPMGLTKWGRFYGNFYDVNYTSVAIVCTILMAIYLFKICKSKFKKILLVLSIFLQMLYLYFGQSRTGLIAFSIAFIGFIIFNYIIKKFNFKKLFVSCCLFIIFVLIIPKASLTIYNYVSYGNHDNKITIVDKNSKKTDNGNKHDENKEDVMIQNDNEILMGRTDYNNDFSNGRLSIWECGINTFKKNPVFGIGFSNILGYSQEKFPESFVAQKKFEAYHNTYIDLLVSQGLIGFLIALSIFIYFAIIVFKTMSQLRRNNDHNHLELHFQLTLMVAAILVSSLLVSQIFYVNNCVTFFFWLIMGYIYIIFNLYRKAKR